MKKLLPLLFAWLIALSAVGQKEKDRLRLFYDEKDAVAHQVGVTVSQDGVFMAMAYDNGKIKIVNLRIGRVIKKFVANFSKDLFDLQFSSDGGKLLILEGYRYSFWDVKTGKELRSGILDDDATRLAVSPTQQIAAAGLDNGNIAILDTESMSVIKTITTSGKKHVSGLAFNPSGRLLVKAAGPENVMFYETSNWTFYTKMKMDGNCSAVSFIDNDRIVFSRFKSSLAKSYLTYGMSGNNVALFEYDVTTNRKEKLFKQVKIGGIYSNKSTFNDIAVDGNSVITVTSSLSLDVVDISSGKRVYTTTSQKHVLAGTKKTIGIDKKRIYKLFDGKSYLINYSDDNINEIYSTSSDNILAYLFSDSDDNLAVASRDGKMDGNSEAISQIFWTSKYGFKKVPLEATFDQFFTPGLLGEILGGNLEVASSSTIENALALAPSVEIVSPDSVLSVPNREVTLRIRAKENGDEVEKFRVFANDKLISDDTRGFKAAGVEHTVTINLLPGKNIIKAVAISKGGYQSSPDQVVIDYTGQSAASKMYILAVGINEYKNPRYNLNYALADAQAFIDQLKANGAGIFEAIVVEYITDNQATKENITAAVGRISNQSQPQDVFVFYYAGHGVMSEGMADLPPDFHLALHDITQLYGRDDVLALRGISAAELREFCKQIPAQKQMIVLDACQSGGAVETFARRGAAEEKAILQLARSAGTVLLASTGSEQFATEFEELGHGVFTYSLIEGFQGKADGSNNDKKVTVKELEAYLNDRIPELTDKYKGTVQYPMSWSRGQDFPVVIVNDD